MTALRHAPVADRSQLAHRCRVGQHDRCSGHPCPCSCEHPTATNARAAKAVVLHARDADGIPLADREPSTLEPIDTGEARLLLDILGIVDGPISSDIQPDITSGMYVSKIGRAPGGNADSPPVRLEPDEPPAKNVTTPPGLRVLPPRPQPQAAARPKPAPKAKPKPRPAKATAPAPTTVKTAPPAKPAAAVKPPRPPRELTPIKHGTLTGHTQHSQRKIPIPPDDPCGCRAARKKYDRDRAAKKLPASTTSAPKPTLLPSKRLAPVLPPIAHGTVEGWQAHHDRGALPVCETCAAAVAPPPVPKTIPVTELLAKAQRSRDPAVVRAAARAIRLLVQIQAAGAQSLADGRVAARLEAALADVSRAQARAASRTNGATP